MSRPQGEAAHNAKLTEGEVREIKAVPTTVSNYRLAGRYGVSDQTISRIRRGITWRCVQ